MAQSNTWPGRYGFDHVIRPPCLMDVAEILREYWAKAKGRHPEHFERRGMTSSLLVIQEWHESIPRRREVRT